MKPLAIISLVVLFSVSAAHATVGDVYVYDFNNLTPPFPIKDQVDGAVTWSSVHPTNQNVIQIRADGADPNNKYAVCNATNGEQLVTSMTNPPVQGSLFNLSSSDTQLRLSYTGLMNRFAGFMVGIWIDGVDGSPNSTSTTELEHAVQFGVDYQYQTWRLRGAQGVPSDARDATGIPAAGVLTRMKVTVDIDLNGNAGDGSMSLTVKNLSTGVEYHPPLLQNVGMSLSSYDPAHVGYGNPARWTGWYIRNCRLVGGDDPTYAVDYHTIDDLRLEVIPEPASIAIFAIGGLLMVRRRR